MNHVVLYGRLGADPELRHTSQGTGVLSFRLATTRSVPKKGQQGKFEDETEWHNVVVWGKRADGLARVLSKGSRVLISGRLRTKEYEDREQVKRWRTEIVAESLDFGDSKRSGGSSGSSGSSGRNDSRGDDDIPF